MMIRLMMVSRLGGYGGRYRSRSSRPHLSDLEQREQRDQDEAEQQRSLGDGTGNLQDRRQLVVHDRHQRPGRSGQSRVQRHDHEATGDQDPASYAQRAAAAIRMATEMCAPCSAASTTPAITSHGKSSSGTSMAHCRLLPVV